MMNMEQKKISNKDMPINLMKNTLMQMIYSICSLVLGQIIHNLEDNRCIEGIGSKGLEENNK